MITQADGHLQHLQHRRRAKRPRTDKRLRTLIMMYKWRRGELLSLRATLGPALTPEINAAIEYKLRTLQDDKGVN